VDMVFRAGSTCAKGFFHTAATAAVGGTCTACTGVAAPGATVTGADLWTCTAAAGAIVSIPAVGGCKAGYYRAASATAPGDTCAQCTSATGTVASSIANAATGATYTCTSAVTGIEFAPGSVKCAKGHFYTAAATTTGASCVACTGAAIPTGTVTGASWWSCATSGGTVVRIPAATVVAGAIVGGCNSGYGRTAGGTATTADTCSACTSAGTTAAVSPFIANALTGSTFTCDTATGTGIDFDDLPGSDCKAGYYYTAANVVVNSAAKCEECTLLAAPTATVAGANWWTCSSSTKDVRIIPAAGSSPTGCNAGYYRVASTSAPGDTCVQCTSTGTTGTASIANAATGATYTCTSTVTGIEFASGSVKCKTGYFYTAAATTAGATCVACTGIAAPTATVAGASDFSCSASAGAIVAIPSGGCKSGFLKVASGTAPGDTCFACTGGYVAPAGQSSAMAVSASIALLLSVAVAALSL